MKKFFSSIKILWIILKWLVLLLFYVAMGNAVANANGKKIKKRQAEYYEKIQSNLKIIFGESYGSQKFKYVYNFFVVMLVIMIVFILAFFSYIFSPYY